MYLYRIYESTIAINISLHLPPCRQNQPELSILVKDYSADLDGISWLHEYRNGNEPVWHRLGRIGSDYLVRFEGYADFLVLEKKSAIHCFPCSGVGANTLEHLLVDQVIPRLISRNKYLVLHAGSVVEKKGAIGFVGKSGSGKSTVTLLAGRKGFPVLTDDCLVLRQESDHFLAYPSYPSVRLNYETASTITGNCDNLPEVAEYSGKLRLSPERGGYSFQTKPKRLKALYIIGKSQNDPNSEQIFVSKCTLREAFSHVIKNMFRLDPGDKSSAQQEFEQVARLVENIPVFYIDYARRRYLLEGVLNQVFSQTD